MSSDIGSVGQQQLDAIQRALMASPSAAALTRRVAGSPYAAAAAAAASASNAAGATSASDATSASVAAGATSASVTSVADDAAVQVQLGSAAEDLGTQLGDAIPQAAQAYDDLASTGHYIHFTVNDQPGSLQIELQDRSGTAVGRLEPSDVLRVASGQSVP